MQLKLFCQVCVLVGCVTAAPKPIDFDEMGRKVKEFGKKVMPVMRGTCGVINGLSMPNDQLQGQSTQYYPGTFLPQFPQFNPQYPQFNPQYPQFNPQFPQVNPQNTQVVNPQFAQFSPENTPLKQEGPVMTQTMGVQNNQPSQGPVNGGSLPILNDSPEDEKMKELIASILRNNN